MTARRAAADATPPPVGEPVSGELVDTPEATVVPSTAAQSAQADRARGRTTIQVGIPAAILIFVEYLCALQGWDLDPWSAGTGLPGIVHDAAITILTVATAFRMNPKPK